MKNIIKSIRKELLEMTNEEISYIEDLWNATSKMKKDFSKDEIIEVANLYIKILRDKINSIEESSDK